MKDKSSHKEKEKSKLMFLEAFDGIIQPKIVAVEEPASVYQVEYSTKNIAAIIAPRKAVITSSTKKTKEKNINIQFSYSDLDAIESARSGIKFNNFKNIYDLMKLPNSKWSEIIGISERTMQNIMKEKKDLDQNKSEKLLSFLTLIEYALDVLGNHKNVDEWLNYKSPSLNGKAPIDYVDTFQGINMLREQLFKIETGNLV